jgi:hypothetical protein
LAIVPVATSLGPGERGLRHVIWSNLIKFIEDLDIDGIKREAGIETVKASNKQ